MPLPPTRYRIHDRTLASEFELPGLPLAGPDEKPDVALRRGQIPSRIGAAVTEGACFQAAPGELLIWLEDRARFLVRDGNRIDAEVDTMLPPAELCRLLLSAPWAALALQAGTLPLHASAILTAKGAVVFVGRAAIGKSALAWACHRRGAQVLADDLAVLQVAADGAVTIAPGLPHVQLWPDMLAAFDLAGGDTGARSGLPRRTVACEQAPVIESTEVAAVYLLERGVAGARDEALTRLTRAGAVSALFDGVFRPAFVRGLRCERVVLAQIATLARTKRVMRLVLPAASEAPVGAVARVWEDLGL